MSDTLFKGLTRPAIMWGVPYKGLILNLLWGVIAIVGLKSLIMALLSIPIHFLMMQITKWDENFFDVLFVWFITKFVDGFKSIYKASSYRP